jgi:hypothetical protein
MIGQRLRPAYEGDHLVECPLPDEVLSPLYSQGDAHRALCSINPIDPIDFAHDLRLDRPVLLGNVNQDHIADLQSLNVDLYRHRAMLRPPAEPR